MKLNQLTSKQFEKVRIKLEKIAKDYNMHIQYGKGTNKEGGYLYIKMNENDEEYAGLEATKKNENWELMSWGNVSKKINKCLNKWVVIIKESTNIQIRWDRF